MKLAVLELEFFYILFSSVLEDLRGSLVKYLVAHAVEVKMAELYLKSMAGLLGRFVLYFLLLCNIKSILILLYIYINCFPVFFPCWIKLCFTFSLPNLLGTKRLCCCCRIILIAIFFCIQLPIFC